MKAYCGQMTESDSTSNIIFGQIRSPCHASSYPKIEMITPTPSKEPKLGSSSVPGQPGFVQKEQATKIQICKCISIKEYLIQDHVRMLDNENLQSGAFLINHDILILP